MARFVLTAAVCGALAGLGLSFVFNGPSDFSNHVFNAVVAAYYFAGPGFLIAWSVSRRKHRQSSD